MLSLSKLQNYVWLFAKSIGLSRSGKRPESLWNNFLIVNLSGLAMAFLITATALPLAAQDLSATIFNQGMQLYASGDFNGASDYLDQVVTMNPQHDQARYYLIYSLSQSGKSRKALQHARILAEKFPHQQQYQLLVQQLSQQQFSLAGNSPEPAGSSATEATKPAEPVNPKKQTPKKQPDELDNAATMIDEEKYASATAELEKILKKSPGNTAALHYLGVAFFNQGHFAKAVGYFEKSLTAGNRDFETRFLAGSCYLNTRQLDKAELHFKKAIEIKADIFSELNLAEIMLKTSRFTEAEKIYKGIQKSHPDVVEAKIGLAQILFEQGYVEASSKAVNEVLAERPDSSKARLIKARILIESKMYAEAAEEAKMAFAANPDSAEYRACLALALIRIFQVPQGIEEARAALQQQPDNIDAMLAITEGFIVSGDTQSAQEQLNAAEKAGQHPGVSFLLASLATTKGDQTLAKQHYENYRKRSHGQPRALLDYARFHEAGGNNEEAAAAYHELIDRHGQTTFADEAKVAIERLAHTNNRPTRPPASRIPIPGLINP